MRLARKLMLALVLTMLAVFTLRGVLRVRYEARLLDEELRERQRIIVLALRAPVLQLASVAGWEVARSAIRAVGAELGRPRLRWVSLDGSAPAEERPAAAGLDPSRFRDGALVLVAEEPLHRLH